MYKSVTYRIACCQGWCNFQPGIYNRCIPRANTSAYSKGHMPNDFVEPVVCLEGVASNLIGPAGVVWNALVLLHRAKQRV